MAGFGRDRLDRRFAGIGVSMSSDVPWCCTMIMWSPVATISGLVHFPHKLCINPHSCVCHTLHNLCQAAECMAICHNKKSLPSAAAVVHESASLTVILSYTFDG